MNSENTKSVKSKKQSKAKTLRRNVPEPNVERMVVTPDKAMEWLETTNTNNRRVSQKYAERLARDIAAGKWRLTHEGIAFDTAGTLLDGQHRLWAIVIADIPIEMIVWRNVDPESMMFIDSGKSRSMADILNIAGENGDVGRYHLSTLRALLGGFYNPPALSPSEMSEVMRRHIEAIEFANSNLPIVTSARGVNTAITRAVIARAYYSVDHTLLKDFCRKLTTGIVTSKDEGVIVLLRQYLQANRGGSYTIRANRYGRVQRALQSWLQGKNLSRLYPASCELFPLPEETAA